jgi:hypothetical protein
MQQKQQECEEKEVSDVQDSLGWPVSSPLQHMHNSGLFLSTETNYYSFFSLCFGLR